jgi:hypothetical protein
VGGDRLSDETPELRPWKAAQVPRHWTIGARAPRGGDRGESDVVQSVDASAHADGASHEMTFTFAHAGTAGDGSYLLGDVTPGCSAASSAARPRAQGSPAGSSKRPQ